MPRTCIICGEPANSREHIFPAALGGLRVNRGIYCEQHNNGFGNHADVLSRQFAVMNAQLGVRDRDGQPRVARVAEIERVHDEHGVQAAEEKHDAAEEIVMDLCDRMAALPATTAEGLRIKLRASAHYEEDHDDVYPAGRLLNSLLKDAKQNEAPAPERDWHAYAALHPGMVPYPAHAPTVLMALDGAIRGEAQRLLNLAEAEIERRRDYYVGFHDPTVWPRVELSLRREMRMAALALAAADLPEDDSAADPVLDAIAVSRRAETEMAAFGRETTGPMTPDQRTREDALCEVQTATRDAVWATVPTTYAGRLALIDYAHFQVGLHGIPSRSPSTEELLIREILGALTAAVRAERPEAERPEAGGECHDLSTLTVQQLARLYETTEALWRITGSFLNAPFAWDDRRENYGPLGRCIERETDRLAMLLSAISKEIGSREDADDDERDERLATLACHGILCNGPIEDRGLVAEIAAAWGA